MATIKSWTCTGDQHQTKGQVGICHQATGAVASSIRTISRTKVEERDRDHVRVIIEAFVLSTPAANPPVEYEL